MLVNSLRFLGFHAINEIKRMTQVEYEIRMEAFRLKSLDKERDLAMSAWFNQVVKATKGKTGKPVYERFSDFFNYEKEETKIKQSFNPQYVPYNEKGTKKLLEQERLRKIRNNLAEYRQKKQEEVR
ncbi:MULTISPECIES: hypothetical protein [Listeria]|uniref:hypothetical protein n=1 Tax=Listeria TaxID=1637 RepID=UPI000B5912EA|nr:MULTISPECIES: hypothetical protein [Listeria]